MEEILFAFIGSMCAGFLFNVKGWNLLWTGFSGMTGWMAYILVDIITGQSVLPIFMGAIAVGIYSETMARILKRPATVFSIPGIFPIVPGIAAYESIQFILTNELQEAGGKIVETFLGAAAIAFGILLVTAFFRIGSRKKPN